MTFSFPRKLFLASLCVAAVGTLPSIALAGTPASAPRQSWTVDVSIDRVGAKPTPAATTVTVSLLGGSCSESSSIQQEVELTVMVCDESASTSHPDFSFRVSQKYLGAGPNLSHRFETHTRLDPTHKTTIGRYTSDTTTTTVTASLAKP
jgi:hypothetical protein